MALIVQKFGGTSVGSLERIEAVAELVIKTQQQGHQVVVVVSAMSGETNRLLNLAKQIDSTPSARELDVLLTTGEQVSVALLAMAIIKRGHSAVSLLADQVSIKTDNMSGRARVEHIDTERLHQELEHNRIAIIAGFQGRDGEGNITTLGRGGTDTTAVEVAGVLQADECQIYTDVDGVYTSDPRIVANARRLPEIHYAEMLELASLGAKVLHQRSVEAASRYHTPLRVLSSFKPDKGTLISYKEGCVSNNPVTGIANQEAVYYQFTTSNVKMLSQLLMALAKLQIEVDMLHQWCRQVGIFDYAFTVHSNDHLVVLEVLQSAPFAQDINEMTFEQGLVKVSVVGLGIKSHPQILAQTLDALAYEDIYPKLMSTTEIKASILVAELDLQRVVNRLHVTFLP
ncbi:MULTISPECIES: aspartate kinase [Pseudoalteromonas]|uniref:Aspartokinase n=1 Tax=Pseudoalteromonas amylolytica TaxID=1859457 RepID=A0A1S1MTI7_9GAMM|nr:MULTISPECIES: aspartate kinase [Pseudoalteromonas]OHU89169.1 aspartate kinase [Pseudoalteromonas sp. JW3]OHU92069.1 aspartate kinase [Pseudoalteromonas amylolytica]